MDSILFQTLPTLAVDSSFNSAAVRLLNADAMRYSAENSHTIRYFFTKRGILGESYIDYPEPTTGTDFLYFPFLNRDEEWNTELVLINNEPVPAEVVIQVIGDNGCQVYASSSVEIPANGRFSWVPLKDDVPHSCWAKVGISGSLFGYAVIRSADGTKGAFVPAVSELSDNLLVEHIAPEVDYWDTRSTIVNASESEPLAVFETAGDDDRTLNSLDSPYSQIDVDWLTDVYGGTFPGDFQGWGNISSNYPVLAGIELFRKKGNNRQQLAGLSLTSSADPVLYMPHVHVEGNYWWTGIVLVNPEAVDSQFTVEAYAEDGERISQVEMELAAGEKLVSLVQNIWTDHGLSYPQDTAWLKIVCQTGNLTGSFLFGTLEERGDRLLAGISLARHPSSELEFGHVTTDTEHWTGISFINTGTSGAQITVQAIDDQGTILAQEEWMALLGPSEKHVSLVEEVFSEGTLPEGTTHIRVLSDQPLVGFELWGNLVPRQDFLCGMLAFPGHEEQ